MSSSSKIFAIMLAMIGLLILGQVLHTVHILVREMPASEESAESVDFATMIREAAAGNYIGVRPGDLEEFETRWCVEEVTSVYYEGSFVFKGDRYTYTGRIIKFNTGWRVTRFTEESRKWVNE